ncbi:Serine/threonine kinase [Podochytrium sp. JEL0797]|nr:Serine/threonine kinase [Podochytrium sp. JEL0797]
MNTIHDKILAIQRKITIEEKTQSGATTLLQNLQDATLKEQCKHTLKESQKRLQYLETELVKLQAKKNLVTGDERSLLQPNRAPSSPVMGSMARNRRMSDPNLQNAGVDTVEGRREERQARGSGVMLENGLVFAERMKMFAENKPEIAGGVISNEKELPSMPREDTNKPVLSDFDYLKSETMITPQKITYKLTEVETKLDIEQKVQTGTERMWQVMKLQPKSPTTNSRNRPADGQDQQIQEKLLECQSKVKLLTKSRQKYKELDLDDHAVSTETPSQYKISKRPQSGRLHIKLLAATALPNKQHHRSDTYVIIKIDGVQKAQSKPNALNKWFEDFEIVVEKALEVEICVYEGGGGILALVWFKLAELGAMLRLNAMKVISEVDPVVGSVGSLAGAGDKTDLWLDLEPDGKIAMKLNFVAATGKLQRRQRTIVRNAPVQKVFPKKGHKFAPTQFYQVMKCAVCYEFLISSQGYQCQACKYTCHKKCQPKVFSKCITLGEKETSPDGSGEDQLMHHRIPHRFEDTYNLGVNWCCHCGYMLPLVKKECRRCSECGISAHAQCALLVPSLCGLTTELIDQMKRAITQAEKLKKEKEIMKAEKAKAKEEAEKGWEAELSKAAAPSASFSADAEKKVAVSAQPASKEAKSIPTESASKTASRDAMNAGRASEVVLGRQSHAPRGIGLDDFNLLAVLGKGNFGKVMLVEEKLTKKHYAIKVLKKDFVIENDESESTRSEKRVFLTANMERFPFLVNLHSCFQTETRLYFVMEFVSGGDLMWHIQHERFSEKRARYYACEVLMALEYFHKHNIAYRDLKLDNILLTLEGHIKIADYGLCKENMPLGATTSTFCGTPEFMAPEILKEKPYTRAVDWWALGVLIYEMILGQSPFPGEGEDQIFDAIMHDDVLFPGSMNKDAVDILKKLLTKDPLLRLGSGPTDSAEIKAHPYFKDVNWDDVLHLKITPPFFPKITSPTDISNFDEEFTKEAAVLTPINMVLSATDQEEFRGFTHIR